MSAGSGTFAGYELTRGTLTGDFCSGFIKPRLQPASLTCISQEFGTRRSVVVGMALVMENNAHRFGDATQRGLYTRALKEVFCLADDPAWMASVVKRGLLVLEQAAAHLVSLHE
jgi:hypothetical protein